MYNYIYIYMISMSISIFMYIHIYIYTYVYIYIYIHPMTPETARDGIVIMSHLYEGKVVHCEVLKCFVLAKCLFSCFLFLEDIGCNRIP